MAGKNDIQIVASFLVNNMEDVARLREEIAKVEEQTEKSDEKQKSFGDTLRDIGLTINQWAQIVQRAGEMARKAFEFAEEGAQLDFLQTKFDRLAEAIGTTGDALLSDLRDATGGIYSDFELIASATDFVALGLAKDHDEAVRLARVAGGLNMNMNQLVLTLTNMTTMRFDAIGVRVDGFKERLADLEAQGYNTNDAFKEAFLQQAEEQLLRVGEAADSQLGTFMRLEAGIKDYGDALKIMASDAVEPSIKTWLDNKEALDKNLEAYTKLTGDVITSRAEYNMHRDEINQAGEAYRQWANAIDQTTESFDRSLMNYQATTAGVVEANTELTLSTEELSKHYTSTLSLITNIADENERNADKLEDISNKMADNRTEAEALYPWQVEELAKLDEKYADLQQAYEDEQAAHRERTNQILYDLLLQKLSVDGLTEAEYNIALAAGEAFGVFDQEALEAARNMDIATQAVLDGKLTVDQLKDALEGLPKHIPIDIAVNLSGAGVSYLGGDLYSSGGKKSTGRGRGFAEGTGGWRTVPEGFPNDTYPVFLTSGEQFAVVPQGGAGVTQMPGGGSVVIQVNYYDQSAVSLIDEERARNALMPMLEQGVRELQAQGQLPGG